MIGHTLSHYKILEKLGEGGMGVLYRALDTHLDRTVAIKVLRPEAVGDPERKRRFVLEAKAASALNHPNIITIYDIDTASGVDFIAMEYVDGRSLDRLIEDHGLPLAQALDYAVQIADALAAAHAAGIVHRDIKPANIMVTGAGHVKVLDFGLAKLTERVVIDEAASTLTAGRRTQEGVILGTIAYMSPEQAEGKPVDARSDVFSCAAALYEMLAGRRPFQADSNLAILTAILHETPVPVRKLRPEASVELERILVRCLEKDREARYASGSELRKELAACQARLAKPGLRAVLRRPQFAVPAVLLPLALAGAGTWFTVRASRTRWALNTALPEIARLIEKQHFVAALRLARQAERYIPEDPQVQRVWRDFSAPLAVHTAPPGARVYLKDYVAVDADWELLGQSPLENVRIPVGYLRFRIAKDGFEVVEGAFEGLIADRMSVTLQPRGAAPPGMVPVPGGGYSYRSLPRVELGEYWLDKYEVTNRQFKEFVDRGGYQNRDYWKNPFVQDGRPISWERAMAEFRDSTGRPGPAAWELGSYPEGHAEFPVGGVSWYEAAAFCESAGKSLPTLYHWYNAATITAFSDILRFSNFGGRGPAPVGSHQGLSPHGAYDMAGNVKEWCWNQFGGLRYILGGSWNDPTYQFVDPDAQSPWKRSPAFGFRCAKYAGPLPEAVTGPVADLSLDWRREKPVGDDGFRFYRSLYSYDRTDLKPVIESVDESSPYWRKERITFAAAYGNERLIGYLFLPKNAARPTRQSFISQVATPCARPPARICRCGGWSS